MGNLLYLFLTLICYLILKITCTQIIYFVAVIMKTNGKKEIILVKEITKGTDEKIGGIIGRKEIIAITDLQNIVVSMKTMIETITEIGGIEKGK